MIHLLSKESLDKNNGFLNLVATNPILIIPITARILRKFRNHHESGAWHTALLCVRWLLIPGPTTSIAIVNQHSFENITDYTSRLV